MKKLTSTVVAIILFLFLFSVDAYAQNKKSSNKPKPRRQFITFTIDRLNTFPLHFKDFPLEQLTGTDISDYHYDGSYRSKDGKITVSDLRFRRPNRGLGAMLYPFGTKNGASLAIRGSYESLPLVQFTINSANGSEKYLLTDGRVYDLGLGVIVNDRPPGWKLGTHSFFLIGTGKIKEPRGNGKRYFIEGGGGVNTGPLGIELSVKISRNHLIIPRPHYFYTVPVCLRATLSF